MKRLPEITLGFASLFGINQIDNDTTTLIVSFCDAQSRHALHCTSHKLNKLSSYNNLENILEHNPNALTQKEKKYALQWAAQKDHTELINTLILHNPDIDINTTNAKGYSLIDLATFYGHTNSVKLITSHQNYKPDTANNYKAAPLYIAAQKNYIDIAKILLDDPRTDINYLKDAKKTSLYMASSNGHTSMVRLLLTHPNIKVNLTGIDCATPLYIACQKGYLDCVKILCLANPKAINICFGDYPPIWITIRKGHLEVVKYLLSYTEIETNQTTSSGKTLFHLCAAHNDTDLAALLLKRNPSLLYTKDKEGKLPWHIASQKGNTDVLNFLLQPKIILESALNVLNNGLTTLLDIAANEETKELIMQYCGKYEKDVQTI